MVQHATRRRAIAIAAFVLPFGGALYLTLRTDSRVDALNAALHAQASPELRHFPFPFRVLRVEGATAIMASPRSAQMPVLRMIGAIEPGLAGHPADDPAFVAAQTRLARVQSEARNIVRAQAGIDAVRWELDQDWLSERGITPIPDR